MPHSFSYAVSMNLEHSIKEGSHERYPDHFQCFRNIYIKKIKYPDFQAMTQIKEKYYKIHYTSETIISWRIRSPFLTDPAEVYEIQESDSCEKKSVARNIREFSAFM